VKYKKVQKADAAFEGGIVTTSTPGGKAENMTSPPATGA